MLPPLIQIPKSVINSQGKVEFSPLLLTIINL